MDMALLPAVRGRGIGSVVVRLVVAHVRDELGWERFTVDPDVNNQRGVNFWRKAGFRPGSLVDDGEREPYLLMRWPPSTR